MEFSLREDYASFGLEHTNTGLDPSLSLKIQKFHLMKRSGLGQVKYILLLKLTNTAAITLFNALFFIY